MSETTNLKLFKHDNPSTNENQFDVNKALNQNWDKLDEFAGEVNDKVIEIEDNIEGQGLDIDELQQKLDNDDWKYFANEDLKTAEETLENLKEQRNNTEDKQLIKDLEIQIKQAEISKEVAEYRINQEIKYGNDYLNQALEAYQSYSITVAELEQNLDNLTYNEKQQYNQSLKYRYLLFLLR